MARAPSGGQLSLAITPPEPKEAAVPRVAAMHPASGPAPFDDPNWFFEPWWPGTPAIAYLDDGWLLLQVEHLADPNTCFPELAGESGVAASLNDDRVVVQGTILVLDSDGRPDADLLRRRLAGDTPRTGVAAFVAFDALYVGGRWLLDQAFEDRRAELARQMTDRDNSVLGRGLRGEGTMLAEAVASMGLAEISARRLDGRYRPGWADGSWLRLPVSQEPAPATRPLLALLQRLPL